MSAQRLPLADPSLPAPAFSEEHSTLLARLVDGLDAGGLWWLSGYAAALAQTRATALPARAAPIANESERLTIVYGSQTGNARRVAEQIAKDAEHAGVAVRLLRADAYPTREWVAERLLYVVISTQGDGDPPDDALGFVEFIGGKRAPRLPELKYAVLGLGDSSYPLFCAIGRRLDARLAELGAQRLFAAGEADVDVDSIASPWRARAVSVARDALTPAAPIATVTPLRPSLTNTAWTRERPFTAELLLDQRITARGSRKDVRHLEFSLAGSGLGYVPGDALGVWHRNPAALVQAVLAATGLDGDTAVALDGTSLPLHEALAARRELSKPSRPFLAAHAATAAAAELNGLLAPSESVDFAALLATHQLIDVLRRWPAAWSAEELLAALRPLTPRLYSISSSQKTVGDEAHLTLDVLRYEAFGHAHSGAASSFLAALAEGASAPVYIEANERFRLPVDASRDVIMIGPGTGVAPFRAFVQEREAIGASGRNWLLFGNPHFRSDFLYQLEWQAALKRGALHELDLAFSRDGVDKVYVQHRLAQRAREVYAWLEGGAHLYVCGAIAMGKQVHAALREVVAQQRGAGEEEAEAYLRELQATGRYARDVY